MIEKVLHLEGIDPVNLYGVNNSKLKKIKNLFPKIKIISRGSELKIVGEVTEVARFEDKFNSLIDYFHRFNSLNEHDIERVIHSPSGENGQGQSDPDTLVFGVNGKPIKARTPNQEVFVRESEKSDLLFAIGPAGTGKTYVSIALAVKALRNKQVRRIILTRPAVEAGEKLGFLPGDYKEKLDPYLQPLYDALNDMIPARKLFDMLEDRTIQIAPLAFMRGRTLSNAFVVLDEAQNTTINQIKMFLTRMGENSKFAVTGDVTQIDLPDKTASGLVQSEKLLRNIEGISIVHFDSRDIVRHRLVKDIIKAYEIDDERNK